MELTLRAGCWIKLYYKLQTQPRAPEDGRNHRPKHIELIGIINKLLLLHLFGCLYYLKSVYLIKPQDHKDILGVVYGSMQSQLCH
jgi:hypothetical protein